jgi:proteasome lid subunit RPN8/RPN11
MTPKLDQSRGAVSPRPCILPAPLEQRLRRNCEARYPEEACGALLGTGDGRTEPWVVSEIRPAPNTHAGDRRGHFLVDPDLQLAAEKYAHVTGRQVIGWYHSHPDCPARPSEHDRAGAWGGTLHLICAVIRGRSTELAACSLAGSGGAFVGVELRREAPGG